MNNPELASILQPVPEPNRDPGLRLVSSMEGHGHPGHERHKILARAVESAGDAIAVFDERGHFQYVNAAFEALLGYPQTELSGQSLEVVVKEQPNLMECIANALWRGDTVRGSLSARTKRGAGVALEATFAAIAGNDDKSSHFVAVLRAASPARVAPASESRSASDSSSDSPCRPSPADVPPALAAMTLEPEKHRVRFGDEGISLTRVEYRIFCVLAENRGKWVSSAELLARAFGADYAAHDSLIRVHVHKIRRKLGSMAAHVRSAKGRGYLFD